MPPSSPASPSSPAPPSSPTPPSAPAPPSSPTPPSSPAHVSHAHDGPVGHRFENAEEWSRRFDAADRDAWQKPDHVVALMELAPGMTVVDLGAGTGYFLSRLSRAVGPKGKVLALDVEPDMVRFMRDRIVREALPNVDPRQVPPDDPQLARTTVDRILIVDTWHHIADRSTYAAKLARALTRDGAIYVVDFTLETDKGPPKDHRLSPEQVISELRAAGLRAKLLAEDLPDQYIVVARKK